MFAAMAFWLVVTWFVAGVWLIASAVTPSGWGRRSVAADRSSCR